MAQVSGSVLHCGFRSRKIGIVLCGDAADCVWCTFVSRVSVSPRASEESTLGQDAPGETGLGSFC